MYQVYRKWSPALVHAVCEWNKGRGRLPHFECESSMFHIPPHQSHLGLFHPH